MVFYHLHGQTGRFRVPVNGRKSSGPVNFVPESPLPFVQISSMYWKTASKAWNWYQRWPWTLMEHEFPFGIFHPEKKDYLFRFSFALGNFPLGRPKKSCSFLFSNRISRRILVNGKQPLYLLKQLSFSKKNFTFVSITSRHFKIICFAITWKLNFAFNLVTYYAQRDYRRKSIY